MIRLPAIVAFAACGLGRLCAHPEIEVALENINAQIAAAPTNATLYVERGELYARHEEWVQAEANYLRAAELAPATNELARARGALALATGRPAEALPFFDAAIALAGKAPDAETLVLRARAHLKMEHRSAALADFNAALAIVAAPAPELFLERAALLPAADAIQSLDAAIERIGPAMALQLRALALEESLGRFAPALVRLDRITQQSERKELWLKRRGDLLGRAGRRAEARDAYAAALAAIAALPDWLRASPDTARLAGELAALTHSRS